MADAADRAANLTSIYLAKCISKGCSNTEVDTTWDGYCVDCGVEVSEARRQAVPSTQRCVLCQDELDKS